MIPDWALRLSVFVVWTQIVVASLIGVIVILNAGLALATSYNPKYEGWTDSDYQRAEIAWVLRIIQLCLGILLILATRS